MHKNMNCGFKQTVNVPSSGANFVGASASRHGLVIMPPSSGGCTITFDQADGDFQGIVLQTGEKPIVICACKYGNLVQRAWFIEQTGGAPGTSNRVPFYTWRNVSKATGGNLNLVQSGSSGVNLWLTTVNASTDGTTSSGEIFIHNGATAIFSGWCYNQKHLNFYDPVGNQAGDGNDIDATYYNSTASVNISMYIGGYAIITTPTITYYELSENYGGNPARNERDGEAY